MKRRLLRGVPGCGDADVRFLGPVKPIQLHRMEMTVVEEEAGSSRYPRRLRIKIV